MKNRSPDRSRNSATPITRRARYPALSDQRAASSAGIRNGRWPQLPLEVPATAAVPEAALKDRLDAQMRLHRTGIPCGTPEEWERSSRWPPRKPVVLWDQTGVLSSASRPATGRPSAVVTARAARDCRDAAAPDR